MNILTYALSRNLLSAQYSCIQTVFKKHDWQKLYLVLKVFHLSVSNKKNLSNMKMFIVLFAVVACAVAAPQFGASGSSANAAASSQTFNAGMQ